MKETTERKVRPMAGTIETMERTRVALKCPSFFVQPPAMATLPEAMLIAMIAMIAMIAIIGRGTKKRSV